MKGLVFGYSSKKISTFFDQDITEVGHMVRIEKLPVYKLLALSLLITGNRHCNLDLLSNFTLWSA